MRFRLRSSSHALPPVLIQLDASASEEPSKISSDGVPSSTAHTDQTGACGAFRTISFGSSRLTEQYLEYQSSKLADYGTLDAVCKYGITIRPGDVADFGKIKRGANDKAYT
jgi:hypothetical protein